MFAAMGSCASIEHVQTKSSACVEVLRTMAHEMSSWFQVRDFHRGKKEVSVDGDIAALCLDIAIHRVHIRTSNRWIISSSEQTQTGLGRNKKRKKKKSLVRDVLTEGMQMLTEKHLYKYWLKRSTDPSACETSVDQDDDELDIAPAFADPDGQLFVDTAADPDFVECSYSNVAIDSED